jgi:hypothetical protein
MPKHVLKTCNSDRYLSVQDLQPYDKNPRKISSDRRASLERSLKELGLYRPLLVLASTNEVIGGNQRFQIIKERVLSGEWECDAVPVTYYEGTREQAAIVAIRDNNNDGTWDYTKLTENVALMKLEDPNSLQLTGFTENELALFNFNLGQMPTQIPNDPAPGERKKKIDKVPEPGSEYFCSVLDCPFRVKTLEKK